MAEEDSSLVAVMGVTGSGKSTFVRLVTGCDTVHIGHGLKSGVYEHALSYSALRVRLATLTPSLKQTRHRSLPMLCQDLGRALC